MEIFTLNRDKTHSFSFSDSTTSLARYSVHWLFTHKNIVLILRNCMNFLFFSSQCFTCTWISLQLVFIVLVLKSSKTSLQYSFGVISQRETTLRVETRWDIRKRPLKGELPLNSSADVMLLIMLEKAKKNAAPFSIHASRPDPRPQTPDPPPKNKKTIQIHFIPQTASLCTVLFSVLALVLISTDMGQMKGRKFPEGRKGRNKTANPSFTSASGPTQLLLKWKRKGEAR